MPPTATLPLGGLRVLEFSHTVMGPVAGLLLAELGADVVKVEPAPDGDSTRRLGGFAAGFFAAFNRSKRSLAIDLKTEAGQAVLHRLADDADIVVENYGPGTMERLGCGHAQLCARNPRLIYLSLKGYLAGPYEQRPALDEVVQFHTGLAYMTGPPGNPLRAGASVIDIMGAVFGVVAVQSALRAREVSGRGQLVGSALFESAAFLMTTHLAGIAATGQEMPPMPTRRGAWAIYQVFATGGDGQLFIGVTTDRQWARFARAFDLPELASDPRLSTNAKRLQARDWLIPALQDVLAKFPLDEVQARCTQAQVSWAPVGLPSHLFDDPHLRAAGGLLDVLTPSPDGEALTRLPALPLAFGADRLRLPLRRQPPSVGEHTREVLLEADFTERRIGELAERRIIISPV